jgi:hypothetical protein
MQRTLATELIALEQQKKLQPVNVLSWFWSHLFPCTEDGWLQLFKRSSFVFNSAFEQISASSQQRGLFCHCCKFVIEPHRGKLKRLAQKVVLSFFVREFFFRKYLKAPGWPRNQCRIVLSL